MTRLALKAVLVTAALMAAAPLSAQIVLQRNGSSQQDHDVVNALIGLERGVAGSGASASQNGDNNQVGIGQSGPGQNAHVGQNGCNNSAIVTQSGAPNAMALYQRGCGSAADVDQRGGQAGVAIIFN